MIGGGEGAHASSNRARGAEGTTFLRFSNCAEGNHRWSAAQYGVTNATDYPLAGLSVRSWSTYEPLDARLATRSAVADDA